MVLHAVLPAAAQPQQQRQATDEAAGGGDGQGGARQRRAHATGTGASDPRPAPPAAAAQAVAPLAPPNEVDAVAVALRVVFCLGLAALWWLRLQKPWVFTSVGTALLALLTLGFALHTARPVARRCASWAWLRGNVRRHVPA